MGERHISKLYEVTGARALTYDEAAAEISEVIGRPVRYRQISAEEFAASMAPYQPREIVEFLVELCTLVFDGRNTPVMHGVEEATGRPARDFSDYVRTAAATGVWEVGQ